LGVLQRFETKQIKSDLVAKKTILTSNINDLDKYVNIKANLEIYRAKMIDELNKATRKMIDGKSGYQNQPIFTVDSEVYFDEAIKMDQATIETFTKENQNKIERWKKVYNALQEVTVGYEDKKVIKALRMYASLIYTWGVSSVIDSFAETLSQYSKIHRTIFEQRGYSESTDISVIKNDLENELLLVTNELSTVDTPEFQNDLMLKIAEQKAKYSIKGGELEDRVNDFASLNHIMSYRYVKGQSTVCEIPTGENKPENDDKSRRLRLAKAKAKAIKIKLQLAA